MKTRKTYTVEPWFYNFFAMHKYQKSKTTFKLSLNFHVFWDRQDNSQKTFHSPDISQTENIFQILIYSFFQVILSNKSYPTISLILTSNILFIFLLYTINKLYFKFYILLVEAEYCKTLYFYTGCPKKHGNSGTNSISSLL